MSTTDPNTPKKKKASGWDKWKAKKKAAAAAAAGVTTGVAIPPVAVSPVGLVGVTGAAGPVTALKNHFAIILDRSGSMASIRDATIKAFNEQVQTVRESSRGQQTDVSLFPFSDYADAPPFLAAGVDTLKELTRHDYVPNGNTALNDAIIAATDKLSALADANDPNTSFLVCVITDGEENNSRHSSKEAADRIKALQDTKRWTFTFVGANVDIGRVTRNYSLSAGNSRGFASTNAGVSGMSVLNSAATKSFFSARSAGATQSLDLYKRAEEMLKKQQEEEAKKAASSSTPTV